MSEYNSTIIDNPVGLPRSQYATIITYEVPQDVKIPTLFLDNREFEVAGHPVKIIERSDRSTIGRLVIEVGARSQREEEEFRAPLELMLGLGMPGKRLTQISICNDPNLS